MAIIMKKIKGTQGSNTLAKNIAYYILNAQKSKCYFCGSTMVRDDVVNSMEEVAATYGESEDIQLSHFVISFSQDEQIDAAKARAIGRKAIEIIGYAHQALYAVHDDTDTIHIHILINPISYLDGHHFCETEEDYRHFIAFLAHLLFYDFHIKVVEEMVEG